MTSRISRALWWTAVLWAIWAAIIYEFKFPIPIGESARLLKESALGILPFSFSRVPGVFRVLLTEFWGILVFFLAQLVCLEIGQRVWAWIQGSRSFDGRDILIGYLAGLTAAGHMVLGLALTGLAFRAVLLVPLLFFLVMGPVLGLLPDAWRKLREQWALGAGFLGRVSKYAAVFGTAACAVVLLVPETAVDALIYHRAIPARMLGMHKLCSIPGNFNFELPAHLEMLGGWTMSLGGEASARLWGLSGMAAGAWALFLLVKTFGGAAWAWFAAGVWLTSSFAAGIAAAGKPDIFMVPLFLAMFLLSGTNGGVKGRVLLAGIIAGAAVSIKLTSVPALAAVAVVLALAWRRPRGLSGVLRTAVFVCGGLAVFGPWALKSFLAMGDPFYPFGGFSPEGVGMPREALEVLRKYVSFVALESQYESAVAKASFIWNATMREGLPPFWLALTPVALFAGFRHNGKLWLGGALMLLVWLFGPVQLRYAAPGFAWLTAAVVLGLALADSSRKKTAAVIAAGFIILQSLRLLVSPWLAGSVFAASGLESRRAFLARNLGTYADLMGYIDKAIPKNARVMFVGEYRSYPYLRDFRTASICEPFAAYGLIMASDSSEAFERRFKQLGFSYVVHNHVGALYTRFYQVAYPWTDEGLRIWSEFWRRHVRLQSPPRRLDPKEGGYYVYRIGEPWLVGKVTPTLPGIEGALAAIESRINEGRKREAFELAAVFENLVGDFPVSSFFLAMPSLHGDSIRSWEYLKKADAGGLRMVPLWEEMAKQAEDRWRLEEAVGYWEKIRRFSPAADTSEYVRLLVKISKQSFQLKRYGSALRYLKRALSLDRRNPEVWAELASFYIQRGSRKEAIEAASEAVRLEPDSLAYPGLLIRAKRLN